MKIPKVPVIVVRGGRPVEGRAMVIPETTVTVTLNDAFLARVVCRPENPEEVAAGLLLTRGLVDTPDKVKALRVHPSRALVAVQVPPGVQEGGGRGAPGPASAEPAGTAPPFPPPAEEAAALAALAAEFIEEVKVKGIFGTYRVAALARPNAGILDRAADVDTPVTVDRVLGRGFLSGLELPGLVLFISGRIRPDTVEKAARCGLQAVVGGEGVTRLALHRAGRGGLRIATVDRGGLLTVFGPGEEHAAGTAEEPAG